MTCHPGATQNRSLHSECKHDHGHGHGHSHAPDRFGMAFAIGIALNLGFVVVEVIYGIMADSLALIADAGHNMSDVLGLVLAWGATVLARRPPTERRTYGLRSSSILAALFNAILLLIAVGGIVWEAIRRFSVPAPVIGEIVIWVAVAGVCINGVTALMFMSGQKRDINIRGAFMHMAADAFVSLGVVVSGVVILRTGWLWVDPVISLIIAVVITWGTWGLLRDSINLALHAVPHGIEMAEVRRYLASLPHVTEVHDLHVWPMSTTETALTAHLVRDTSECDCKLLEQASLHLNREFAIQHATIQFETADHRCHLASGEGV